MVLQMGANDASGQELQLAPKNRCIDHYDTIFFWIRAKYFFFWIIRANFFLIKLWTYHFLFSPSKLAGFA
jgi:hypothetical protein